MPTLQNPDNTLKSLEEVRQTFENAGVNLQKPIIFTCGGGVMATYASMAAQ